MTAFTPTAAPSVGEKSIEANSRKKHQKHTSTRKQPPLNIIEKGVAMVDDLQKQHDCSFNQTERSILECISRLTFQNQPATNSSICQNVIDISLANIKQTTYRLHKHKSLLYLLPERKGYENLYVLSNMQHLVKTDNAISKKKRPI
jgi:hypothetical protein